MKKIFLLQLNNHNLSIFEFIAFFTNMIISIMLFSHSIYYVLVFTLINVYSVFFHSKLLHYVIPTGFINGYFISYVFSNDYLFFLPIYNVIDKIEFLLFLYLLLALSLSIIFLLSNFILNLFHIIKKPLN